MCRSFRRQLQGGGSNFLGNFGKVAGAARAKGVVGEDNSRCRPSASRAQLTSSSQLSRCTNCFCLIEFTLRCCSLAFSIEPLCNLNIFVHIHSDTVEVLISVVARFLLMSVHSAMPRSCGRPCALMHTLVRVTISTGSLSCKAV
mgnify:FL=1